MMIKLDTDTWVNARMVCRVFYADPYLFIYTADGRYARVAVETRQEAGKLIDYVIASVKACYKVGKRDE